ncbi:MAG TPA: hypothetical protein VK508_16005 [Cyclobacteriaceae bacterium]|nr:hypothetical protein [Cyclobacteriaceae bacterium]
MKYGIIGVLLLAAEVCFSQSLTVKSLDIDSSEFTFPVIESAQRPEAAKKINAVIQKDWGYDPNAKDSFGNMEVVSSSDDFGYSVTTNNERMLSLVIQSSYSGCGLHITRHVYNFDSRTGESFDGTKLFGTEGQVKLKKALFKSWKALCEAAVADPETPDYYLQQYKDCLAAAGKQTELDYSEMKITDQGIEFSAGSCLEGTTYDYQADVTQGPHVYSPGQMLPMLTPYGYSLFFDPSSGPVQALMRGTIDGKYAISLTLLPAKEGSTPDAIGGMIVYDRIGQPINLSGTMNGNKVVFHELDESKNALSNIEATWDGTKLTGMFTNLKSKKQMPFVASVVGAKK